MYIYITSFITLCTCFAQAIGILAVKDYPLTAITTWHECVILGPRHGESAHLKLGYSLFQWERPSKFSLDEGKLAKNPIRQTDACTPTLSLSNALCICWFWKNLIKVSCEISKEKNVIPYSKCAVIVLGSPCLSPLTGLTVRQHNLRDQKAETGHACFSSSLRQSKWQWRGLELLDLSEEPGSSLDLAVLPVQ